MESLRKIVIVSLVSLLFTSLINAQPITDSRFLKAINVVLLHEGGLSNDKNDEGGITNFGISLRFLRSEHIDINGDGVETAEDIIHLTQSEADSIYLNDWYLKYHYDRIKSDEIMIKVLDGSVNMGASRMHRILKEAVDRSQLKKVEVDGTLDDKTIDIINHISPQILHKNITIEEMGFYNSIIRRHPSFEVFRKGWMARAQS